MKNDDKKIECDRYDERARLILSKELPTASTDNTGALGVQLIYRAPYYYYEDCINRCISPESDVLELGAGTGLHTMSLVKTGARVVASDISGHSLRAIDQKLDGKIQTVVADMESLPFDDCSFDAVACAGSLSYGESELVDAEVRRVLKPGGIFICVDSLNHNPIYKLNRWVHFILGDRTNSTLLNMPTISRIDSIAKRFEIVEVKYFGALTWLMPMSEKLFGAERCSAFSDKFDRFFNIKSSAFKFVLVAYNRQ